MSHMKRAQPVDEHSAASQRVAVVVSPEASGDDRTIELAPVVVPIRRRVLLVEPNCHRRAALAHRLRSYHSVATTSGMEGALRLLGQERFDVVVAAERGDGDGLQTLEAVARAWPATKRCLTATWHDPASKRARKTGVVHVLIHAPVDVPALAIEVGRLDPPASRDDPQSSVEPRRRPSARARSPR